MADIPTQFELILADEWADRIISLFPEPWSELDSRQVGGILYALAKVAGGEFEVANRNLRYVLDACRLQTASGEALDRFAFDFFGPTPVAKQEILRAPGEDDESLRKRIEASLLLPLGTREALIELIRRLTGQKPRLIEPWQLNDTGAYEANTYWDIDTPENPGRYADPSMRFQLAIESPLPSFGGQGDNPVYCYDAGAAYDAQSGYYIDAKSTWFLTVKLLDALINKVKVFGTIVWRKYRSQPQTAWALGGTKFASLNSTFIDIEVYPQFIGFFSVLASANWNTEVIPQVISNSKFRIYFSVAAPAGAYVDWLAAPVTVAGYATVPVAYEAVQASIAVIPEVANKNIFVSPNWATNFWLADSDPAEKVIEFSTEAPSGGQMAYVFIPSEKSGWLPVEPDTEQAIITIQTRDPFQAFVIPTWNTTCEIIKAEDHLTVNFSTPPVEPGRIYFGIHES